MSRVHRVLCLVVAVVLAGLTGAVPASAGSGVSAVPASGVSAAAPPSAVVDWEGLPTWSGGYGPMRNQSNGLKALRYAERDYGINLNWTDWPNSRWEVYGEGLPTNAPITSTTKVALRVPGGGYLRWGAQSYGIDLVWSATAVYEWNLITTAGGQALFNRSRNDYVVYGSRPWGVNLIWSGDAMVTPPDSGVTGVRTLLTYNCHNDRRPLRIWINDMDAGGVWTDLGLLGSQWSGSSCPVGSPFNYSPTVANHRIQVVAVDYSAPGCANDPLIGSCRRSMVGIISNPAGGVAQITVS
ncbi:hypothetical protein [Micromonospora sp. WMMD708]|uniref:hypothetical protein n=1 Tax=Micromonospora sp. WMMD708 TaxID=3403464 RepID=UPI003BF497CE